MRKTIEYNGQTLTVCSDGTILGGRGRALRQYLSPDGYPRITAGFYEKRGRVSVHRLVAEAFISNPGNLETVDHIDNDKENNEHTNLRWVSRVDNVKDAQDEACIGQNIEGFGYYLPCQSDGKSLGFQQSNISHVICGRRRHHKGFKWEAMNDK